MKELFMDAAKWKSIDDLYLSFFEVVKAPSWHGKNLDAIRDSIGAGQINGIEVPYRLVFINYGSVFDDLKKEINFFIEVISDLANEGIAVEIRIEDGRQ